MTDEVQTALQKLVAKLAESGKTVSTSSAAWENFLALANAPGHTPTPDPDWDPQDHPHSKADGKFIKKGTATYGGAKKATAGVYVHPKLSLNIPFTVPPGGKAYEVPIGVAVTNPDTPKIAVFGKDGPKGTLPGTGATAQQISKGDYPEIDTSGGGIKGTGHPQVKADQIEHQTGVTVPYKTTDAVYQHDKEKANFLIMHKDGTGTILDKVGKLKKAPAYASQKQLNYTLVQAATTKPVTAAPSPESPPKAPEPKAVEKTLSPTSIGKVYHGGVNGDVAYVVNPGDKAYLTPHGNVVVASPDPKANLTYYGKDPDGSGGTSKVADVGPNGLIGKSIANGTYLQLDDNSHPFQEKEPPVEWEKDLLPPEPEFHGKVFTHEHGATLTEKPDGSYHYNTADGKHPAEMTFAKATNLIATTGTWTGSGSASVPKVTKGTYTLQSGAKIQFTLGPGDTAWQLWDGLSVGGVVVAHPDLTGSLFNESSGPSGKYLGIDHSAMSVVNYPEKKLTIGIDGIATLPGKAANPAAPESKPKADTPAALPEQIVKTTFGTSGLALKHPATGDNYTLPSGSTVYQHKKQSKNFLIKSDTYALGAKVIDKKGKSRKPTAVELTLKNYNQYFSTVSKATEPPEDEQIHWDLAPVYEKPNGDKLVYDTQSKNYHSISADGSSEYSTSPATVKKLIDSGDSTYKAVGTNLPPGMAAVYEKPSGAKLVWEGTHYQRYLPSGAKSVTAYTAQQVQDFIKAGIEWKPTEVTPTASPEAWTNGAGAILQKAGGGTWKYWSGGPNGFDIITDEQVAGFITENSNWHQTKTYTNSETNATAVQISTFGWKFINKHGLQDTENIFKQDNIDSSGNWKKGSGWEANAPASEFVTGVGAPKPVMIDVGDTVYKSTSSNNLIMVAHPDGSFTRYDNSMDQHKTVVEKVAAGDDAATAIQQSIDKGLDSTGFGWQQVHPTPPVVGTAKSDDIKLTTTTVNSLKVQYTNKDSVWQRTTDAAIAHHWVRVQHPDGTLTVYGDQQGYPKTLGVDVAKLRTYGPAWSQVQAMPAESALTLQTAWGTGGTGSTPGVHAGATTLQEVPQYSMPPQGMVESYTNNAGNSLVWKPDIQKFQFVSKDGPDPESTTYSPNEVQDVLKGGIESWKPTESLKTFVYKSGGKLVELPDGTYQNISVNGHVFGQYPASNTQVQEILAGKTEGWHQETTTTTMTVKGLSVQIGSGDKVYQHTVLDRVRVVHPDGSQTLYKSAWDVTQLAAGTGTFDPAVAPNYDQVPLDTGTPGVPAGAVKAYTNGFFVVAVDDNGKILDSSVLPGKGNLLSVGSTNVKTLSSGSISDWEQAIKDGSMTAATLQQFSDGKTGATPTVPKSKPKKVVPKDDEPAEGADQVEIGAGYYNNKTIQLKPGQSMWKKSQNYNGHYVVVDSYGIPQAFYDPYNAAKKTKKKWPDVGPVQQNIAEGNYTFLGGTKPDFAAQAKLKEKTATEPGDFPSFKPTSIHEGSEYASAVWTTIAAHFGSSTDAGYYDNGNTMGAVWQGKEWKDKLTLMADPTFRANMEDAFKALVPIGKIKSPKSQATKTEVGKNRNRFKLLGDISQLAADIGDSSYPSTADLAARYDKLAPKLSEEKQNLTFGANNPMVGSELGQALKMNLGMRQFSESTKSLGFSPYDATEEQSFGYAKEHLGPDAAGLTPSAAKQWMLLDLNDPLQQVPGYSTETEKNAIAQFGHQQVAVAQAKITAVKALKAAQVAIVKKIDVAKSAPPSDDLADVAVMTKYKGSSDDGTVITLTKVGPNKWQYNPHNLPAQIVNDVAAKTLIGELNLTPPGKKPEPTQKGVSAADYHAMQAGLAGVLGSGNPYEITDGKGLTSYIKGAGGNYVGKMGLFEKQAWVHYHLVFDELAKYQIEYNAAQKGDTPFVHKDAETNPGSWESPAGKKSWQTLSNSIGSLPDPSQWHDLLDAKTDEHLDKFFKKVNLVPDEAPPESHAEKVAAIELWLKDHQSLFLFPPNSEVGDLPNVVQPTEGLPTGMVEGEKQQGPLKTFVSDNGIKFVEQKSGQYQLIFSGGTTGGLYDYSDISSAVAAAGWHVEQQPSSPSTQEKPKGSGSLKTYVHVSGAKMVEQPDGQYQYIAIDGSKGEMHAADSWNVKALESPSSAWKLEGSTPVLKTYVNTSTGYTLVEHPDGDYTEYDNDGAKVSTHAGVIVDSAVQAGQWKLKGAEPQTQVLKTFTTGTGYKLVEQLDGSYIHYGKDGEVINTYQATDSSVKNIVAGNSSTSWTMTTGTVVSGLKAYLHAESGNKLIETEVGSGQYMLHKPGGEVFTANGTQQQIDDSIGVGGWQKLPDVAPDAPVTFDGTSVAKPDDVDQGAWDLVSAAALPEQSSMTDELVGEKIAAMQSDELNSELNTSYMSDDKSIAKLLAFAPLAVRKLALWAQPSSYYGSGATKEQSDKVGAEKVQIREAIRVQVSSGKWIPKDTYVWAGPGGTKWPLPPGASVWKGDGSYGAYLIKYPDSTGLKLSTSGAAGTAPSYFLSNPASYGFDKSVVQVPDEVKLSTAAADGFNFTEQDWNAVEDSETKSYDEFKLLGEDHSEGSNLLILKDIAQQPPWNSAYPQIKDHVGQIPPATQKLLVYAAHHNDTDFPGVVNYKLTKGYYSPAPKNVIDPNANYASAIAAGQTDKQSVASYWTTGQEQQFITDYSLNVPVATSESAQAIADKIADIQSADDTPADGGEWILIPTDDQDLGGIHTKIKMVNKPDGTKKMVKQFGGDSNGKLRVDAEHNAMKIGRLFGFRTPESRIMQVHGKYSYVQSLQPAVGDLTGLHPKDLTDEQLAQAMQEHVLDWLLSNHDTYYENLMVAPDDSIFGIDKGQAGKYFPHDKLAMDYWPGHNGEPGNNGNPVWYDEYYHALSSGQVGQADADVLTKKVLTRALVMQKRMDNGFRSLMEASQANRDEYPDEYPNQKALIDAYMDRKHNLLAEFTKFYKGLYKKGGLKWTIDEDTLMAHKLNDDTYVQLNPELLAEVQTASAHGKSLFFAGEDLENGHVLLYTEDHGDPSPSLRGEAHLNKDADLIVTKWLKKQSIDDVTDAPQVEVPQETAVGVSEKNLHANLSHNTESYTHLVNFIKTVSGHASDGQYNSGTVTKAEKDQADLKTALQLVKASEAAHPQQVFNGVSGDIGLEFYTAEQQEAWKLMAETYIGHYEDAFAAKDAGQKVSQLFPDKGKFSQISYAPTAGIDTSGHPYKTKSIALPESTAYAWSDGNHTMEYGSPAKIKKVSKGEYIGFQKAYTESDVAKPDTALKTYVNGNENIKLVELEDGTYQQYLDGVLHGPPLTAATVHQTVIEQHWALAPSEAEQQDTSTLKVYKTEVGETLVEQPDGTWVLTTSMGDDVNWSWDQANAALNDGESGWELQEPVTIEPDTEGEHSGTVKVAPQKTLNVARMKNSGTMGKLDLDSGVLKYKGELYVNPHSGMGYHGYKYVVTTPDHTVEYRPWHEPNVNRNQQGLLRFEIKNWSGNESQVEDVFDTMRNMGVELNEADEQSMELFYWRHLYRLLSDRKDRDSGKYGKARAYIKEHQTKGMSADDELTVLKAGWALAIGQDKVDNADWMPHFSHTRPQNPELTTGKPYWNRPDVTVAELRKWWPDRPPTHALQGNVPLVDVLRSGGLIPTEERLRLLGQAVAGESSGGDQTQKGSAAYLFTRQNLHSGSIYLWPTIGMRTTNYAFMGDQWGQIDYKKTKAYFDPAHMFTMGHDQSTNEMMVKDQVSLLDDIGVIEAGSHRAEVLAALKKLGITSLHGIPIEELVVEQGTDAAVAKVWKRALEEESAAKAMGVVK